uniref:ATP synthase F0 subunit 8 n=1 Tax=Runaria punctata TaxID=2950364 RepID=A0A977TL29_9HYME|nr:ATP synthase F0 subunit 8 [Runaria punctata]UXW93350.1 ATP synthase F0 subunit 8 [Runaria punctata]
MPQMAPIMWIPLYIYFNLILLLFFIMVYYFFTPINTLHLPTSPPLNKPNLFWKW